MRRGPTHTQGVRNRASVLPPLLGKTVGKQLPLSTGQRRGAQWGQRAQGQRWPQGSFASFQLHPASAPSRTQLAGLLGIMAPSQDQQLL